MGARRTYGMTVLAVVNFLFGALLVGGGALAVLVGHASLSRTLQTGPTAAAAFRSVALGLLALAVGIVGVFAGVGLLKVARWAFAMCIAHASALTLLQGVNIMVVLNQATSADTQRLALPGQSIGLVYPLAILLLSVKWRRAFTGSQSVPA